MKKISGLLLLIGLIAACAGEPKKDHKQDIQGKWELYSAERDGKDIPTLEGVFFRFNDDQMESNFPIQSKLPYTIKVAVEGETIKTLNTPETVFNIMPEDYKDTLQLSANIRNSEFVLLLRRGE